MTTQKNKKLLKSICWGKKLRICFIFLILLFIMIILENNSPMITEITVENTNLPRSFDGFRIAHVSDFHNDEIGIDNSRLIELIEESEPDIIAITGDLIDSRRTDVNVSIDFISRLIKIAPCYYVPGNHESRIPEDYELLLTALHDLGVNLLIDESIIIERNEEFIDIVGIEDPMFDFDDGRELEDIIENKLNSTVPDDNNFQILLSHRPEYFDKYVEYDIDLVLAGHAHGGQIRIPFLGGIIAPGQGFFPNYDSGIFTIENTAMIVSRGIGNSIFPVRINNRPEVVLIELKLSC